MAAGPLGGGPSLDHAAQRLRMGDGECNVADDRDGEGHGEQVVDKGGPGAHADRERKRRRPNGLTVLSATPIEMPAGPD